MEHHQTYRFLLKSDAPRVALLLHSGHQVNELEEFTNLSRGRKATPLELKEERELQIEKQFHSLSEKTHLRVVKHSVELDRQFYTLQALWAEKALPLFHRYYLLKMAYSTPLQLLQDLVHKEMVLLARGEHLMFKAERAIKARAACLSTLRQKLGGLGEADVYEHLTMVRFQRDSAQLQLHSKRLGEEGFTQAGEEKTLFQSKLEDFFGGVRHLHKLTYYVVQLVASWREYLKSLTPDIKRKREGLVFYRQGANFLLSLLNDNHFFRVSPLAAFFQFGANDPFLFHPFLLFYKQSDPQPDDQALADLLLPEPEDFVRIFKAFRLLSDQFEMHLRRRKYHDVYESDAKVRPISRQVSVEPRLRTASIGKMSKADKLNYVYHQLKQLQEKYLDSTQRQIFKRQKDNSLESRRGRMQQFSTRVQQLHRKGKIDILKEAGIELRLPPPSSPIRQLSPGGGAGGARLPLPQPFSRQPPANATQTSSLLKTQHLPQSRGKKQTSKQKVEGDQEDLLGEIREYVMDRAKREVQSESEIRCVPVRMREESLVATVQQIFGELAPEYRAVFGLSEQQLCARIRAALKFNVIKLYGGGADRGYAFSSHDVGEPARRKFVIELVMTKDIRLFQQALLATLDHLWACERPDEVAMTLLVDQRNQLHKGFEQQLRRDLERKAFVFSRPKLTNLNEVKFLFKKPLEAKTFHPRAESGVLSFELEVLGSDADFDQTIDRLRHFPDLPFRTGIDYLLAEYFRAHLPFDSIAALKAHGQNSAQVDEVLRLVLLLQKRNIQAAEVTHLATRSFEALNEEARSRRAVQYPFSDKGENRLKRTEFRLKAGAPFALNLGRIADRRYFRLQCRQLVKAGLHEGAAVFQLPTSQSRFSVVFMEASHYLKEKGLSLAQYCKKTAQALTLQPKLVKHLWLPQFQFEDDSVDRQLFRGGFTQLPGFDSLPQLLLFRERTSFCYEELTNSGLQIGLEGSDSRVGLPAIVMLLSEDLGQSPAYCRLIMEGLS